jgi:hypothetical protein
MLITETRSDIVQYALTLIVVSALIWVGLFEVGLVVEPNVSHKYAPDHAVEPWWLIWVRNARVVLLLCLGAVSNGIITTIVVLANLVILSLQVVPYLSSHGDFRNLAYQTIVFEISAYVFGTAGGIAPWFHTRFCTAHADRLRFILFAIVAAGLLLVVAAVKETTYLLLLEYK